MISTIILWLLYRFIHIAIVAGLFIIYGVSWSSFSKDITAFWAFTCWLGFYLTGSYLWEIMDYSDIGCGYLILSIFMIPFSILTLKRKWIRIWAPITTLIFSLFIIIYNGIYLIGIIPYILFWILCVDLADNLMKNGLTRKSFNLISEIIIIVFLCMGIVGTYYPIAYLNSDKLMFTRNSYCTVLILILIRNFV